MGLPEMNGYGVCRAIKTDPETAAIRVVMLTVRAGLADQRLADEAGADAYLTKPFSPAKLDELEAVLKRDGAVIESPQGRKAHPAAVEPRQQRIALARLLAALQLPKDAEQAGKRPGRRGAAWRVRAEGCPVRLRRQEPQRVAGEVGDALVMPLQLVDRSVRRSWAQSVAWSAERRRWLRDHGIDPADWSAVYPVLLASWEFHGIPSA